MLTVNDVKYDPRFRRGQVVKLAPQLIYRGKDNLDYHGKKAVFVEDKPWDYK